MAVRELIAKIAATDWLARIRARLWCTNAHSAEPRMMIRQREILIARGREAAPATAIAALPSIGAFCTIGGHSL